VPRRAWREGCAGDDLPEGSYTENAQPGNRGPGRPGPAWPCRRARDGRFPAATGAAGDRGKTVWLHPAEAVRPESPSRRSRIATRDGDPVREMTERTARGQGGLAIAVSASASARAGQLQAPVHHRRGWRHPSSRAGRRCSRHQRPRWRHRRAQVDCYRELSSAVGAVADSPRSAALPPRSRGTDVVLLVRRSATT